ncbi:MAG TPA: GerMN domain-containing protein [Terriglobales bacterium]|nr:GerMN domain-containing protein [Terriglobales bacterium]
MTSRSLLVVTLCLLFLAIAMVLYVWQLRSRAQVEATLQKPQIVAPPATGTVRQVTLWVAHDDPGVLRVQAVSLGLSDERQRKTEAILRALLAIYTGKDSPHHLAPGADVRNVYFVDPGLVVVDVNAELADGQTSGILPEQLMVASLVQTLSSNSPGISRVKFLVNGKERETLAGHVDFSSEYEVSQMSDLARQLSSE